MVRDTVRPATELRVLPPAGGDVVALRYLPAKTEDMWHDEVDRELREYAVGIDWIVTMSIADAVTQPGIFANQNTARRLREERTIDLVLQRLGVAVSA